MILFSTAIYHGVKVLNWIEVSEAFMNTKSNLINYLPLGTTTRYMGGPKLLDFQVNGHVKMGMHSHIFSGVSRLRIYPNVLCH